MPRKQVSKKSSTQVSNDGDHENKPNDGFKQDQNKAGDTDKSLSSSKDVLIDKTNLDEGGPAQSKNLGKRKASGPLASAELSKKIKGNEGQSVDTKDVSIEVEGQSVKKDLLMGPSKEDVADQFQVEIKYSNQSKSYENGMQVVLEHLESNFPGLTVKQTQISDKEKFDILLQRKDDNKELIVFSKQILGDSLPTKRNSVRFDEKFKKALIEMKQIETTMNQLMEVSKENAEAGISTAEEIREKTQAPLAPGLDANIGKKLSDNEILAEPEAIAGPLQPGTHQEIVNEVKQVDQDPIA